MKNMKINNYWLSGLMLLLVVVNLVYAGYFMEDAYPGHNMISNLVMAAAPISDLGLPYKDYWDIYPPGIYLLLSPLRRTCNSVVFLFFLMFKVANCNHKLNATVYSNAQL
jgi:hypothetical protein